VTDAADLVVWRHGRTEWNETGRFQGQLDPPLDPVGHGQARAAAAALAQLPPGAIISSDLDRAATTASYLAELTGLAVVPDPRLREIDVGAWGGLTRPAVEARYPDTFHAWLRGEDVHREGGESLSEVATRARAAVDQHLAALPRPLVVVTHGGTARALVLSLLGLPVTASQAFAAMGNARWAALEERRGAWRLTAYNVGRERDASEPGRDDATPEPVL